MKIMCFTTYSKNAQKFFNFFNSLLFLRFLMKDEWLQIIFYQILRCHVSQKTLNCPIEKLLLDLLLILVYFI